MTKSHQFRYWPEPIMTAVEGVEGIQSIQTMKSCFAIQARLGRGKKERQRENLTITAEEKEPICSQIYLEGSS